MESLETAAFVMQAISCNDCPFWFESNDILLSRAATVLPARRIESSEWDQNSTQAH